MSDTFSPLLKGGARYVIDDGYYCTSSVFKSMIFDVIWLACLFDLKQVPVECMLDSEQ